MFSIATVELPGMPEIQRLRRVTSAGKTLVSFGDRVVFRYDEDDLAMRNIAIVSLTDAGVKGLDVAEVFGVTAPTVSRLRARARRDGVAGLVERRGRPPKLSERQVNSVRRLGAQGEKQADIAKRYGVAPSVISELLAKSRPLPEQDVLEAPSTGPVPPPAPPQGLLDAESPCPLDQPVAGSDVVDVEPQDVGPVSCSPESGHEAPPVEIPHGQARISAGTHPSRYAGAALLYVYLSMVGATELFSVLSGGRARRYDDQVVIATALVGFALGASTVEGIKHLRRSDAGALVGVSAVPELRTLRERLSDLADGSDPLALQRAFAKAMLAADPPLSPVYYVDDHFVAYSGGRTVAKGWNTRRRLAEAGRDDTVVSDERGRPVLFASSEPSGLSKTITSVLDQLREVTGEGRLLIGFDRGGSFPVCFKAIRDAQMDWVTYRRGKLTATTARPVRRWCARGAKRVVVTLADEVVAIAGYGQARQLTLYERGAAVLQVLTSDMESNGAALLCWLRSRWRIENLFKYAAEHNGIDSISSYAMDQVRDDRKTANPRRKELKALSVAAEAALIDAERALAKMLADPSVSADEKNAVVDALSDEVQRAGAAARDARAALKGIPAEVPRTALDPKAKRAVMRLERRGLQMVLRLLAFNAEAWLAEHFNAYFEDPDEFRATTRHLLQLGGSFNYEPDAITVTIDRPDSPRVAGALELLLEELNAAAPAYLLGDRRQLRYTLTAP